MSNGSNRGTCIAALSGVSDVYCLTHQQKIGLVVVALSGFASLIAVLVIFTLIARNVIYSRRLAAVDASTPSKENESSEAGGEASVAEVECHSLIQEPMDLFMLSLFLGSFFQALGVVLEIKWIHDGNVRAESFCTAQGVFQNLGQAAVAMQTTIITLHTFSAIWWRRGVEELRAAWILVGTLWLFLILFITISASVHDTPPFYYPTPYWCWIHSHYSDYRIAGETFWLWLAFAVAVALYTPLCFHNVGYISPVKGAKWTFKINSREKARDVRTGNIPTSKLMICAMAYCVPVLPTALARWFLVVHGDVKPFASAGAQFSVKFIFSLSGVSDVVVFLLARQNNLLFGKSFGAQKLFNIPPLVRIGAWVAVWIALNVSDVVWIYYYILSATDPVPRRKSNETREGWKSYYVMMYVVGFIIGLVNLAMTLRYIRAVWKFTGRLKPLGILRYFVRYFLRFLIIALATIMCLGPFFGPLIGLKLSQAVSGYAICSTNTLITPRHAWNHRCDPFPVEVILDGRPYYDSIKENPSNATFYFGQPGRRTEYYKYGMTQDNNDTTIWHLRLRNVTIPPDLDPVYHPVAQDLSYRFANNSVTATCTTNTSSSAVTVPCMEGSFSGGGKALSLTINDTRIGIVTKLRAVDKGVWAPIPAADDAPSVLLRAVQPDDSLGFIVMLRTAVTMEGKCSKLKLCLANQGIDLLAAVGRILKAQDDYSYVCTTPNSN